MSLTIVLLPLWMVATLAALPSEISATVLSSPCPNFFRYESEQPGQWSGNLLIQSDNDLFGLWIRLIFDNELKELTTDGHFDTVADKNEVLIKNRNIRLKANTRENIKITVKYDGNKIPKLIGYRLNAKPLCPELNSDRSDVFLGDSDEQDFLSTILLNSRHEFTHTGYECGLKSSSRPIYPWKAAVFIKQGEKEKQVCEATLISPSHLLTAAHCVTFRNENVVIPTYFASVSLGNAQERFPVEKILVHPGYEARALFNDLAVLKLSAPLNVNDYTRPICIGTESTEVNEDSRVNSELLEVKVKKISANECVGKFPELKNVLQDDTYCVSYVTGNSNCVGDSGSSFISLKDNVGTLKGVVTLSAKLQNKCNSDKVLVVTDVHKHLKWIQRVIR